MHPEYSRSDVVLHSLTLLYCCILSATLLLSTQVWLSLCCSILHHSILHVALQHNWRWRLGLMRMSVAFNRHNMPTRYRPVQVSYRCGQAAFHPSHPNYSSYSSVYHPQPVLTHPTLIFLSVYHPQPVLTPLNTHTSLCMSPTSSSTSKPSYSSLYVTHNQF